MTPESLKSHKTVFSDNHSHKALEQCETQASFRKFYLRKNVLISSGNTNDVKIRIWSKSLGTQLLITTGLIEIPWRSKEVLSVPDISLRQFSWQYHQPFWILSFHLWRQNFAKILKMYQILWLWLSEKTVFRYFCSIYAFRSQMVPHRTK